MLYTIKSRLSKTIPHVAKGMLNLKSDIKIITTLTIIVEFASVFDFDAALFKDIILIYGGLDAR
jgi:hypothetical protein